MLLHEHPSFKSLIETIAFEKQIPVAIVEKDYWVMHALLGLTRCGFVYYFKGGTSLSKGFDLIKRFSEDIDRAKQVMTYRPEYTFIEKLDAINRKYQGERPAREWVRHYYDVFMLLQDQRVQSFIGSEDYREYMNECFGERVEHLGQLPAF